MEGPEQFLWRGRLWKVCDVLSHSVETGPWWQSSEVPGGSTVGSVALSPDLTAEREIWRVEAAPGLSGVGRGVFDLMFDWTTGSWQLVGCVD